MSPAPAASPLQVSVIIPCRNAERTVGEAVRSALGQTEPPLEVLVVDDASTDTSAEAARRAGAQVLVNERRRYAGGARNRGLHAARGSVLAFLDADAVASPAWLERARADLESDSAIAAVGGRIANGRAGWYGWAEYLLTYSEWVRGNAGPRRFLPTMCVAYRRSAVEGLEFPETSSGEDAAFSVAATARGGKLWFDPLIVVTHYHERLDAASFLEKQVSCGRTFYLTRRLHDLPGRFLVRYPLLILLLPHLWISLARLVRAGLALPALAHLPWLLEGEVARTRGFFEERRLAREGAR